MVAESFEVGRGGAEGFGVDEGIVGGLYRVGSYEWGCCRRYFLGDIERGKAEMAAKSLQSHG